MATTLSQFWKRWHMTLNDWFIENVYIPLGGNRKGTIRKYINVMLVFIFSGLWHGAAMHYIIWGGRKWTITYNGSNTFSSKKESL